MSQLLCCNELRKLQQEEWEREKDMEADMEVETETMETEGN